MTKPLTFIAGLLFLCGNSISQIKEVDSLKHQLENTGEDTIRVLVLSNMCFWYRSLNTDSSLIYGEKSLALAQHIKFRRGEASALNNLGFTWRIRGDVAKSLELQYKGLQISVDNHYPLETTMCLNGIGAVYGFELNDYPRALGFFRAALKASEEMQPDPNVIIAKNNLIINIGSVYIDNKQFDSAIFYLKKAYSSTLGSSWVQHQAVLSPLGNAEFLSGNYSAAFGYLQECINGFENDNNHRLRAQVYTTLAGFFKELNQHDSCIYYATKGLTEGQSISYKQIILKAAGLLAEQYESSDVKQAFYYSKIAKLASDDLFGAKKVKALQKIISDEQDRQRGIEASRVAYRNRVKQYALLAGLGIMLLIGFLLYRNNLQKQRTNVLLEQQKEQIQNTLSKLKAAQSQLIQSEKMASLGELTAGIAHEIQNPLNFVNNFSEVSNELIQELKTEKSKAKTERDEQMEDEILNDISQNLEKINHHGKRADAIVKGMLQHSRSSTGQKEPTGINALADEYLRLAYHGLRGKDSSFNVTMKTDFDETIGNVNIIPQDIGRVLLNLYNNAFYAVQLKQKKADGQGLPTFERLATLFEPVVTVSTKKIGDKVLISVKDNGDGIPQKIVDKIFQPFFTTKPTGLGTGLGLSLSYDIIKAHGGEIKVETKEGEGSEFIVSIPINK